MTAPTLRQLAHYTRRELATNRNRSEVIAMIANELLRSGRQSQIEAFIQHLYAQYELDGEQATVSVQGAAPIPKDVKQKFENDLRELLKVSTVRATFSVDEQLISGFTAKSSVVRIDASGIGILKTLRQEGFAA